VENRQLFPGNFWIAQDKAVNPGLLVHFWKSCGHRLILKISLVSQLDGHPVSFVFHGNEPPGFLSLYH